eukprot:Clim_evm11s172 gene=Clim_evmTU11s172
MLTLRNLARRNLSNAIRPVALRTMAGMPSVGDMDAAAEGSQALHDIALQAYDRHAESFKNIDLDALTIEPKENVSGQVQPVVYMPNTDLPGLRVLSPWANALFSFLGPQGDLVLAKKNADPKNAIVRNTDPALAGLMVAISKNDRMSADLQAHFDQYVEFLKEFEAKLLDHIAENLNEYPSLRDKKALAKNRGDMEATVGSLEDMLTSLVKTNTDPEGHEVPGSDYIIFRKKLYISFNANSKPNPANIITEIDQEMYDRGLVRRSVAVYDRFHTRLPQEQSHIRRGSIVSVLARMDPIITPMGISIRRQPMAVVILENPPKENDQPTRRRLGSPYEELM